LYLFGVLLSASFLGAYNAMADHSASTVRWLILQNFATCFAFALNVFCIFLFLHLVQWFVAHRLGVCASRFAGEN